MPLLSTMGAAGAPTFGGPGGQSTAEASWEILLHSNSTKANSPWNETAMGSARYNAFGEAGSSDWRSITAQSTGAALKTEFGDGEGLYKAFFNKTDITKIALVTGTNTASNGYIDMTTHSKYLIYDLANSTGTESIYDILKRLDNYNINNANWCNNDSISMPLEGNNVTGFTNQGSGTLVDHGPSNAFWKTVTSGSGGNVVPDKFAVWGINQASDNDTQVLVAYNGYLTNITTNYKGDSFRNRSPAESFYSYWGNDWHSSSQGQTISAAAQSDVGVAYTADAQGSTVIYMMAF